MCGRICFGAGGAGATELFPTEEPELEVVEVTEPGDDPEVSESAVAKPSYSCRGEQSMQCGEDSANSESVAEPA